MRSSIALAVLSAVLLILSFPGFNMWIFAWVAFIPLFFAIEGQKPFKAFLISYLTGFLFFLGTIYWLIHVTLPGMIAVVSYLALYFGFFGLFIAYSRLKTPNSQLLFIPAAWVTFEWIRANALTGFGWNLLGYSQASNLHMIQIADITGAYGVGFVILALNTAIYAYIKNFKDTKKTYISLATASILLLVIFGYGALRLNNVFTGEKIKVAIVQGNIPQDEKWDRRFTDFILSRYAGLTRKAAMEKVDMVIWPETSVPGFLENEKELYDPVSSLAKEINAPILVGSPRYDEADNSESYYNSALLVLSDGTIGGHYDKIHLVPFGEYVPFKNLFSFVHRFAPRPIGDCAAGKDFTVLRFLLKRAARDEDYNWKLLKKVNFSCLICFEDVFPDLARKFVKKNADFLVNITNDAWFGKTSAAYQHAQASIFRAVENRTNVLRAANTGLSCFIDQKGRITGRVAREGRDLFIDGFGVQEIVLSRVRTFYTRYGDVFAYMCIFFVLLNFAMRLKKPAIILFLVSVMLYGCDSGQYQIITGSDGSLYRFNKKTGELSMIMDDKKVMRLPESKKSDVLKPGDEHPLEKPVIWAESRFPTKDLRARLETVWRENKLCYKFSVYPYKSLEKIFARKKQDYIYTIVKPGFDIVLLDKNGFMVKEIKVNLWNMTKVAGEGGKDKGLVLNSQTDCTKQSYRSIGGYSIKWQLDPDLIDDEKEEFIKSSSIKGEGI